MDPKRENNISPSEDFVYQRRVELLVPELGIAAIVTNDGILGSPGTDYVHPWLLKNAQILASIDMHPDTFQPGTSVQASVFIVGRLSETEIQRPSKSLRSQCLYCIV